MSAAENLPPDYYRHPEPPRRRRNWKRIIGISAGALLILVIFLFAGIYALLNNLGFRQYVIRKAVVAVKDLVGADIHVRDFGVHLSGLNPTVDMYDVAVDGAAPYINPPFIQADRLSVSIRIDSFVRREWYLSNIELDHPVARILIDEQGRNNMPVTKQGDSQTDLFELGIRQMSINRGEIYYNDHKSEVDGVLRDLAFQSTFDPIAERYSANLNYSDGNLKIEGWNPVTHGLEANFEATREQFKLNRAFLTSGPSHITLSATLDDYAHQRIQAAYQASVDAGNLRQVIRDPSLPVGVVNVAGSMKFQERPNVPLLDGLQLDGNVTSNSLLLQTASSPLTATNISARYVLDGGDLRVQDMRANVLGGGLNGELTILDVDGAQDGQLRAALKNVALTGIQSLLKSPLPRDVTLTGTANADVNAKWTKSFSNLVANTDANLRGTVRPNGRTPADAFPLNGEVHARYNGANEEITFTRTYIRTPQTTVNLNGTVSERAALQVQLQSNDLREVETIVDAFYPMETLGLSGMASFAGSVRGSTSNPQFTGQLQATDFHVRGSHWRSLRTGVDANPSMIRLRNGELLALPQGELTFNVSAGLANWSFTETSPLDIDVKAANVDAATLVNLTGRSLPVSGTLAADISMDGSQLNPSGNGSISLTRASVYDEPIDSVIVNFEGTGSELRTTLNLRMPAGTAQGNFTLFPKQKGYDGQLEASVRLEELQTIAARNVQLTGMLDLKASGTGTMDNPEGQLTATIQRLQIQNQTISGLTLQADIHDKVADVRLDSETRGTFLRGEGKLNLTGNYDVDARLDTSPISLQPLIAAYFPAQATNVSGATEVHATVRGPLKEMSQLDAHVTIPVLTLSYRNTVNLSAASPIEMDYEGGVLRLQRAVIKGTGTDLQIEGSIPVASTVPASLRAVGTIDLQIAQLVDPDITSSGQLRLNVNSSGSRADPNIQGRIEIVNAAFATGEVPLGLQNGNGLLRLTSDRIEIERFNGNVGGGTLTAQGGLTWSPSIQFNIRTNATGVRLLYPDNVRERVDTNLTLTGSDEAAVLSGQVRLTELSFTPDFDLADMAADLSGTSAVTEGGFASKLRLDIGVQSTSDLNLISSTLTVQGAANLQVRGTAARPVIVGRLNLTGGDLIFRGNRYLLQPSTIDFVNPVRTEPIVNAVIDTTVQEYDIHMRFRGTLDRLQTTYTSDPALPHADIINLLVFGKTVESIEANPGNLGAESLIASSVSSQITSRVAKVAGISHLSIDPVLGSDSKDPGARITLQQRVTGNLFVTFAADVTGTQKEVIKLEYQATPRVSLSGVRDQNGGFAVDMRVRKSW